MGSIIILCRVKLKYKHTDYGNKLRDHNIFEMTFTY